MPPACQAEPLTFEHTLLVAGALDGALGTLLVSFS